MLGKRLHKPDQDEDAEMEGPPSRKSPRGCKSCSEDDHTLAPEIDWMDSSASRASITDIPSDLTSKILSYLDVSSLLRARELNRSFRNLASQGSAGWENLCHRLWADKVHVLQEAKDHRDPMAAYRLSVEDAKTRDFINLDELLFDPVTNTGTVWSFRFKEAAGPDWTSWDPWYRGEPCRKMVFLSDGSIREYKPINEAHGNQNNSEASLSAQLAEDPFSRTWRFLTRPLDMPTRPTGSYVRISVGGRDVPTYCIRRSPTSNWGFVMESCWGVCASFELPQRRHHEGSHRRRIRRAQDVHGNWFNVVIEASDDDSSHEERSSHDSAMQNDHVDAESSLVPSSQLLVDDDSFSITSALQWREAFLYNFGAQTLPEGEEAVQEFERTYAVHR